MVAGNIKRELYVGMEAEECRNQTPRVGRQEMEAASTRKQREDNS